MLLFKRGFTCLLTRDRLFGESASKVLKRFPRFSVVLIDIPQVRGAEFAGLFREAWGMRSLLPVPGAMIRWPAGS